MSGFARYLELTIRSKTGLGGGILVWSIVAVLAAAATLVCFTIAAFVSIAQRSDAVVAGLALGGFFLLIAAIAAISCIAVRHRAIERARLELAARGSPLFDPALVAIGLQVARTIGLRRVIPLAAVAILASGLAREWQKHEVPRGESERRSEG